MKNKIFFILLFITLLFVCGCGDDDQTGNVVEPINTTFNYYYDGGEYKELDGQTYYLNKDFLKKDGYSYEGAYDAPRGQGVQYFDENGALIEGVVIPDGKNIYAYFVAKTYTISFNVNGQTFSESEYQYDSVLSRFETPAPLDDQDFVGWYIGSDQITDEVGNVLVDKEVFNKTNYHLEDDTVVLIAKYVIRSYEVIIDYSGLYENIVLTVKHGNKVKFDDSAAVSYLKNNNLEVKGYTYTYGGDDFYDGEMVTRSFTLYALLEDFKVFTIINASTQEERTLKVYHKTKYTADQIAELLVDDDNYYFDGFYISDTLNGSKLTEITYGLVYQTLYYDIPVKKVYYHDYDNAFLMSVLTENLDSTLLSRAGYTFKGVYSEENGHGAMIFDETGASSFTAILSDYSDVYAYWKPNKYTIEFYSYNDLFASKEYDYDLDFTSFDIPNYIEVGYHFVGWCLNDNLITDEEGNVITEVKKFNNANYHIGYNQVDNVKLYAKFALNEYIVNINYLGFFSDAQIIVKHGEKINFPEIEEVANHDLLGYIITGEEEKYYANETVTSDLSLVADIRAYKLFTLISEGKEDYIQKVYERVNVLESDLLKNLKIGTGHYLNGLFTGEDLSGEAVKELKYEDSYEKLYYSDELVHYQIRYNTNFPISLDLEDKVVLDNRSFVYGQKYEIIDFDKMRIGDIDKYVPIGWSNRAKGDVVYSLDYEGLTNLTTNNGDVIDLYIVWGRLPYRINYIMNENRVSTGKSTTYTEDLNDYRNYVLTKARSYYDPTLGFEFVGWSLTCDGAALYSDEQLFDNLCEIGYGEITLYAIWKLDILKIGQYVDSGTIVKDFNTGAAYTVYNSIDSSPWRSDWCTTSKMIFDWRKETNLNVEANTNIIKPEGNNSTRFNNFDFTTNVNEVIFIGKEDQVFTNLGMYLVNFGTAGSITFKFYNFNYVTNATSAINVYESDDNYVDGNANLTLHFYGKSSINSSVSGGSIFGTSTTMLKTLKLYGDGEMNIVAGNGANGNESNRNGSDGGSAIYAKQVAISIGYNASLLIEGGRGGDGYKGADSTSTGSNGSNRAWIWEGGAGNGGTGGTGGVGGSGGAGGSAIVGDVSINSAKCTLKSGDGGNGAKGGTGAKGGNGGNNTAWGGSTGNGGTGGKGGAGGNGGAGGAVVKGKITENATCTYVIGTGGTAGAGGTGGAGGNAGVANSMCGGGGTAGKKGADGAAGTNGADGVKSTN